MSSSFVRISKREAQKRFNAGTMPVYLCPCKLRPGFPWNVACLIFGKEYLEDAERYAPRPDGTDGSILWKGTLEKTAWDLLYNNWAYYNATYETGYYAHYYVQK
jgi:hypothetical protein